MKQKQNKKPYKRIALVLSICVLFIWAILGTGASLAWFTDTSPEINNIFHFAEFDVVVSHRLPDGKWEEVDSKTKVFDEKSLHEPGHVQVVYLQIENKGSVPFEFYTAVNVNGCIEAVNMFGQHFMLQDYLKFGITSSDSEALMYRSIPNREAAEVIADMPLEIYADETAILNPGDKKYIALIVRMPENVGNIANYRGDTTPQVELGITVMADQLKD